ncbi:response regulator [Spirochaetia bacterium]|nr:response regulator [Spirochaetia bacterium]
MKVLIVDDSRYMRKVVQSYFTEMKLNCIYTEASNGQEALELLKAGPVDLVMLDWNMPRMSGIDFLKEVRSMEQYKKLPVIMVTSESAKLNVIEAFKNGVTAYLVKPIDGKAFREKISNIVNR